MTLLRFKAVGNSQNPVFRPFLYMSLGEGSVTYLVRYSFEHVALVSYLVTLGKAETFQSKFNIDMIGAGGNLFKDK